MVFLSVYVDNLSTYTERNTITFLLRMEINRHKVKCLQSHKVLMLTSFSYVLELRIASPLILRKKKEIVFYSIIKIPVVSRCETSIQGVSKKSVYLVLHSRIIMKLLYCGKIIKVRLKSEELLQDTHSRLHHFTHKFGAKFVILYNCIYWSRI